ncbi:hypothetical protein G3N95_36200 [Paraburkholderia sp. Tr-20389]|uniref:hypothetical protein n=1 Tax=Paraburkholderia sp. Tr-20389 TaxID=2703903 RepID=UPI00197E6C85|nr:hypothetical protein [Paraburkholderia sp. Tr-20389]MBN3758399.1 hypothetical protein [Paraburkholderia sp. Tr-20389]
MTANLLGPKKHSSKPTSRRVPGALAASVHFDDNGLCSKSVQKYRNAPVWSIKQSPVWGMRDCGASGQRRIPRFPQTVSADSLQRRVEKGFAVKWRTRDPNMAQKLLYWSRSNWRDAGSTFPCKAVRKGGRIEAGQLDWAAVQPAEFVNQEIGYE